MTELDDFGTPDREGFEALLATPFVEYSGMLFRQRSFDAATIEKLLQTTTQEQVQRYHNHTHLFLYAADIDIQRKWAKELETIWSTRFASEFPSAEINIDVDDNEEEVILTFWRVSDSMSIT